MKNLMQLYLANSDYIDWQHPLVHAKARELAKDCKNDAAITKRCFEFVRDDIKHSWDYQLNPVTCKASEVLTYGTGYCYAKSHLLAALLRANAIPAGLCYQRLSVYEGGPPYCLHGLNAVFLKQYGWYRIDARGHKKGVNAEFTPPLENLAFAIVDSLERDFPEIWVEPLTIIVKTLTQYNSVEMVSENLPDLEQMDNISANKGMIETHQAFIQ